MEVRRFRGSQFDARVVDTFIEMVDKGAFRVIEQSDATAQQIQRIIREAAKKAAEERERRERLNVA